MFIRLSPEGSKCKGNETFGRDSLMRISVGSVYITSTLFMIVMNLKHRRQHVLYYE